MKVYRSLLGVALLLCGQGVARADAQAPVARADAQAPVVRVRSTCGVCHSELEFLRQNTDSMARALAVHVSDSTVAASAHGKLACAECHTGFQKFPHARTITKGCSDCHARQNEPWLRGAHVTQPDKAGAACSQCHGVHTVQSAAEMKTKAGSAAMNRNCVACHQPQKLGALSPHAEGVLCSACHGAHETQPANDRSSRLWANQQLQTCGTCHDTIAAGWAKDDIHAQALLTRRRQNGQYVKHRPPACTDCHGAHGINVAPDSTLVQAGYDRCAECHDHFAGAYGDTYHGQAKQLGSRKAASCANCHTAHSIKPSHDQASSVAHANLTRTCGQCHERANASFVKFDPHVNPHDRSNPLVYWVYKFMTLLLMGTMAFFGLHALLWLTRLALERRARRGDAA
jgi:hypothetical protein